MGNENSKSKEATQNGTIPEKHENGSVLSAEITSNGLEIDVKGETVIHQNGGAPSLNYSTESTEPDYVVVEAQCKPVEAAVISEIPVATIQKEVVKKSKEEKGRLFGKMFKKKAEPLAEVKSVQEKEKSGEDQTDANPPATDPQPESGSSGHEAAAIIVVEHREDFEYLRQKAEISTQTDRKTEADISTQTGEDGDDDTTTNTEGPVEEVGTATEEVQLNESVVIAEEAVEETADEEPQENQTAGIIIEEIIMEEIIMENIIYENKVFRAERVEVTDNFEITHIENYSPEEERVQETEPEVAAQPESIKEAEIVVEEHFFEETETLEISSLPKVVADCVEAVFAVVSESTDFTAVNRSEEVITEGNSEGARDISAGVALIETTEPKTNAVTPEAEKANGVASLDEEPVTTMMETISEVVCDEPNPPPADKDMPERECSVPLVPIIIIMKESSYEGFTTDEAVSVEDVPGMSEEVIIVEAPSNELITTEELPQDALNTSVDEVKPESIPKVITPDEKTEVCKGMTADEETETTEEAEPRPVIVRDDAEMIPEAATDALSQYLELCAIAPQQPAVDNGFLLEEVISATTFVPLSGERQANVTIPEELIETTAKEINEEVVISEEPTEENPSPCEENATTEVLVNILESVVEAFSERLVVTENIIEALADVPQMDASGESEPCVSVQEELVEENVAPSLVAVEEPTDSSHVISEEPLEESVSPLVPQVQVVIMKTIEDEVTAELIHESNHSCDVVAAIDENAEDSQIATSDEAVAECFEAFLETIVEEIITEVAITPQEPAVENYIILEEEVIATGPFVPLSGEQEANITIPEESRERTAEEMKEEVTKPESVEEDTTVQASSNEEEVTQIVGSTEPVEEKTEVSEYVLAQAETPKQTPVEDVTTEVMENILESVGEVNSEKLVVSENKVEKPANVQQMDTTGESKTCFPVQEDLAEEKLNPAFVALKEPTDSSPVISGEPVLENVSLFEHQVLVVNQKNGDKVCETDNSGDDLAQADENTEDSCIVTSDEAVAECVEAVLETIVEEIIAEGAITALDNAICLKEEVLAATPFVPLSGEQETSLTIPEEPSETVAEKMDEGSTKALSNETTTEPESVEEDGTGQESSTEGGVFWDVRSDEPVEEKTEVPDDCLTQAETPKQIPVISEEPAEENPSPCEEDATTEVLVNILESVVEALSERLVVTENIIEALADVPQMDAPGESEPCISIQEELVEENVSPSLVAVEEPTDSSHVIFGEPILENASLFEHQVLVVNQKNGDKVCETDNSGDDLAQADENTEDSCIVTSDEAVAECVEAVLETIVEEIIAEGAITALDSAIRLKEEVLAATPFVPLSGEQETSLTIPEEPSETVAEKMDEGATKPLSNETTTEPESVEEDATCQESSTEGGIFWDVRSDEPVEEKTVVSDDCLTQAETPKQIPAISEEPVEENPSPCEEYATTEVYENILESVAEVVSEIIVEEPADVLQADAIGESEPRVSFQEVVDENVNPSVVAVEEPTASIHVFSEEPVEESLSLLEPPLLVVIIETTDEELIEEMTSFQERSDIFAAIDKNSEDSQNSTSDESVAECFKAALETVIEEVITEEMISGEKAPKITTEGETEEKVDSISDVNSTDSTRRVEMTDDTPITSTDMKTLLARLRSACTSIVEESAYRLDGINMSFLGCSITVTIKVAPKDKRQ